jgi:hypothetical protein
MESVLDRRRNVRGANVRMELVANPDFHADLCGVVHRSDTPALMLNKYRAEPTKYWLDREGSRI